MLFWKLKKSKTEKPEKRKHQLDPPAPKKPKVENSKAETSNSNEGKTILIAEDNLVNQQVVRKLFSLLNIQVVVVENGLEAYQQIKGEQGEGGCERKNYQLVLMDLEMPVMDGYSATEAIRALETERGWAPLPIVGLTANAMLGTRTQCLTSGMNDVLSKPVLLNDLKRVLEKYTWC